MGPTIVYPPDPETMRIFDAIGGAIGVESLPEYVAASVGSAASGGYQKTAWRPLRRGPTYPV